ncbi:MAG: LamG domain-containing protein [Dysgonamonadaceae bacterium]|jgi:hypothetical protein|nr:LamG domain-containing protein [Dysgonamonadaceae bacterium]
MKKMNLFKRTTLLVVALAMVGGLCATTNFYAWEFKNGHNGIAAGELQFTDHSISIEFWINMTAASVATAGSNIFETWGDPYGFLIAIREEASGNKVRFLAKSNDGETASNSTSYAFLPPADSYTDKWAHLAFVVSESEQKAYCYLNGELYGTANAPLGYYGNYRKSDNAKRTLNIAGAYWNSAKFYGKLADIRIWSVARTAEEIKVNYNKNLTGTYADNPGLYLNYRFSSYERGFNNEANPAVSTNKAWCNPEGNWNTYYTRETLSAFPQNLAVANEILSWDTGEGEWEVSVFKSEDDANVFTGTVSTNSIPLQTIDELEGNTDYYAKVRTLNNGVWSGQVTSGVFTVTKQPPGFDIV